MVLEARGLCGQPWAVLARGEQLRVPTQAEDRGAGREGGGSARASAAPTVFSPRSVSPVTRLMLSSQTSFPDRAHSEAGTLGLWCSLDSR